jgi:hypothetical protein
MAGTTRYWRGMFVREYLDGEALHEKTTMATI